MGKRDNELCEYDLDNEDEDWLAAFNGEQSRLPAERCVSRFATAVSTLQRSCNFALRFEAMLWKLELACANAQMQARGTFAALAEYVRVSLLNACSNRRWRRCRQRRRSVRCLHPATLTRCV